MASNYPAGAEHDPNAPYNQGDYPPRPHEVELSLTFKVNAKGIDLEDVDIEVTRLEADYNEDGYGDYEDYDEDFYYFHGED